MKLMQSCVVVSKADQHFQRAMLSRIYAEQSCFGTVHEPLHASPYEAGYLSRRIVQSILLDI